MTKKEIIAELLYFADQQWRIAKNRADAMSDQSEHPQVAKMITKNFGYMSALEDMTDELYRIQRKAKLGG